MEDDYLRPSYNLRNKHFLGVGEKWIKDSYNVERFLNLTLSLIHPKLFETGLDILRKLREWDDTKAVAREWQLVYTGISVINNWVTPSHRDSRGRAEWYDLLANYCDEDDTAVSIPHLLIRDLGLDLSYSSGTVVSLCGSVLEHEVGSWGLGDRVSQAHFM